MNFEQKPAISEAKTLTGPGATAGSDATESVVHPLSAPVRLTHLQRYGIAVVSVGVALGAALLLEYFRFRDAAVPLLLFAVATSSWYGGKGPAILAVVLSSISFDYFFVPPFHTLYVSSSEVPYLIIFASFASLVSWFSRIRRRVEQDLRQTHDKLQIEVAERTQQARLLDLTHDSIFVRDMDFIITYSLLSKTAFELKTG
jgi:K+-sensing histidine kinase KdpD